MSESKPLVKAELRELDTDFETEINKDKWTKVQFNPETLKVSFANQIATPSGSGDQNGPQSRQFVGAGTTKLTVQLWFDVTASAAADEAQEEDVRKLTQRVAYFITPREVPGRPPKFAPPVVRFIWGSFQFDGIMESMEESLEFFSHEGRPLRASVSFGLSQQKIQEFKFRQTDMPPGTEGASGAAPGTAPLTPAPAGSTLQGLAATLGKGVNWQNIAAANGIENPRRLAPGQLIDLNAGLDVRRTR